MIIVANVEPTIKIKPAEPTPLIKDKNKDERSGGNAFGEELKKEQKKREELPKEKRQVKEATDTYIPSMNLDEIIEVHSSVLTNRGNINSRFGIYDKNGVVNFGR